MGTFSKVLKYKKPSLPLDEKIRKLDKELKKTLGEAITNSTSGLYTVTGFEPGDPAIPEIPAVPAVPPTYENVTGGLSNPNDFVWGDQGDGSDPDAPVNIPANLYTTYNGQQVAAVRQIEGEYPVDVTPLAFVFHERALASVRLGYLTSSGFNWVAQSGVYTTPGPRTALQDAYINAWNQLAISGYLQYFTSKTIYLWGGIEYLVGGSFPASAYYPAGRTNETNPPADRGLYPYQLLIPTDANGNVLPNRIMTDPGVPEIPAIPGTPEGPPRPVVISRNGLGDPNYYPGPVPAQGQIAQMGPNQVYPLLDIIRQSPPGPTRNNAIQQLNQWAKPGSKNRDILIKLGVPLEGASTSSPQGDIAQAAPIDNTPPRSKMNYPPIDQPSPGTNVELQKAAERAYKRMGLKGA